MNDTTGSIKGDAWTPRVLAEAVSEGDRDTGLHDHGNHEERKHDHQELGKVMQRIRL